MPSSPFVLGACETRGGRGRGRVGVWRLCCVTPAVNCISSRNVSRSDANLRNAFSKSTSLRPDPPKLSPLIVALLRLLAVTRGLVSWPVIVATDWRFSLKRWPDRRRAPGKPSCEVGRIESVSRARSSSIVSSTGGDASGETTLFGCRRSS